MAKLFAEFSVNVLEKMLKSNLSFLPIAVCFNDVNSVVFWESSSNRVVVLLLASFQYLGFQIPHLIWVGNLTQILGGLSEEKLLGEAQ